MIVHVQEFRPGRSPFSFEIAEGDLREFLQDIDDVWETKGEPLRFEGEVDRLADTLHIRGELSVELMETCARCVQKHARVHLVPIKWTLLPLKTLDTHRLRDEEEVELSTDDLDTSFYKGDEIAISELVREALLLELDPAPVCGEEGCDDRLSALLAKAIPADEVIDPRWEKLAALKGNLKRSDQE